MAHQIARRYRGGKPKSFFPWGVVTDFSSPQLWTSAFANSATGDYATFIAAVRAIAAGSTTLSNYVNVSYFSGSTVVINPVTGRARNVPTLRTGGPVVDSIVASTANTRIGSQRRRIRKV
jgi:hypothetical protein